MKYTRQVVLGILHQFENCHKILHLFLLVERRASPDQPVPDHSVLEDLSGHLVSLGQSQSRLEVQECQKLPDHLGNPPEHLLSLMLGRKHL